MSTGIFCDVALAARIDRAEARLCAELAGIGARRDPALGVIVLPVAGGLAVFAGPGAPMSKVIGLGLGETLHEPAIGHIESEWGLRGESVRVELSTLDDGAIARMLTARGYRLLGFENVLGHRLGDGDADPPLDRMSIERIDPAHLEEWTDLTIEAFSHPDAGPLPTEEPPRDILGGIFRDMTAVGGMFFYMARLDGRPAGAASVRVDGRLAQLTGAATLPMFRRLGIQTALTKRRLADARAAGCDLAVVTTAPGSKSQENAQRGGFELLYSRAILVK